LEIFEDEASIEEIASLFQLHSIKKKPENKMEEDTIEMKTPTKTNKNLFDVKETIDLGSVVNSIREEVEAECLMKNRENIKDEFEIASRISNLSESTEARNLYKSLETHIYYYMNLQLEPKEIRAIIMKSFDLTSDQADKVPVSLFNFLDLWWNFKHKTIQNLSTKICIKEMVSLKLCFCFI
jgi:hypothetical protein